MEAQLQFRVTQVKEMNRQITKINDKINFLYRHLKAFKTLQATQNSNSRIQCEINSMTNDVGLNAESDLHLNQDDIKLWFKYECYYGRLHYNYDIHAKRRGQLKSNQ